MLTIAAAMRKQPKWGLSISGDSFDLVERPRGGLSLILADGQGTGEAAKRLSGMVVARTANLIAEGARDGAVARAVHDLLYALRGGRVLCTLTVVSVDLYTGTLVVSRNSESPVLLKLGPGPDSPIEVMDEPVEPIGVHDQMKPAIRQWPVTAGMTLVAFTDGLTNAGKRRGRPARLADVVELLRRDEGGEPEVLADHIFDYILDRCAGRPEDDVTVLVLGIREQPQDNRLRTLSVRLPFSTSDIGRRK